MNTDRVAEWAVKIRDKVDEVGVVDALIPIVETIKPESVFVLEPLNAVYKSANQMKLQYMLSGLAEGLDMERKMNDLYNYVKNRDRAFYVSECVQKVLLSNAPVVCCILGLMLSDLTQKDDDIDQIDAVLLNALSGFTDEDIRNFSDIVSGKYLKNDLDGDYIDTQMFPENKMMHYGLTVDLCTQSRILQSDFATDGKGGLYVGLIKTTIVSDRLNGYVNRARRQLNYGIDSHT